MICIFDYMDNKYLLTSGHGLLRGLKFIFFITVFTHRDQLTKVGLFNDGILLN